MSKYIVAPTATLYLDIDQFTPERFYQMRTAIAKFQSMAGAILKQVPDSGLVASLGFSASSWRYICSMNSGSCGPQVPKGLFDFPGYQGPDGWPTIHATGGDIFIHAKSSRKDALYALLDKFLSSFDQAVVMRMTSIDAWHNVIDGMNRDLTGYVDGTVNCPADQRIAQGLIGSEDPAFVNGSFAIAQKWIHDMDTWNNLTLKTQDSVFGRTKLSSSPLPNPLPTAHMVRVQQSVFKYFIVRQAMPWGDNMHGNHGLFFIAYSKDSHNFDQMLRAMVGNPSCCVPPGQVDAIMKYSTPLESNFWYFPTMEQLSSFSR